MIVMKDYWKTRGYSDGGEMRFVASGARRQDVDMCMETQAGGVGRDGGER